MCGSIFADKPVFDWLWNTYPMPQKQLILHVGFHKSGTTALQETFFAQRKELETQGVLYPSVGWQAHHRVAWAMARRRWGWKDRGGKTTPYSTWTRMLWRIKLSKLDKVVLSSEFFSELTPEKIQLLKKQMKGRQVKVLFTLRPLVKLLASSYQQYLKYGLKEDYVTWLHSVLDVPGESKLNPTFWKRHMHGEVVERWASVFGAENVTVVIVDEQKPEFLFDSVNDYLDLPRSFLKPQATGSNRSLSLEEQTLLLEINKRFPKERSWPEYLTFIRNGYVRELTDKVPVKAGKEKLPTPSWAIDAGNKIASHSKQKLQELGVTVYGDLESLDSALVLEGVPTYPESIDIETIARAMLVFRAATASKFAISWLVRGLLSQLKKGLRTIRIR
ncbi:MAG: hypothetical protein RLZZ610_882 [Actinomycetota bacterium]|jgi:hypothetical protein